MAAGPVFCRGGAQRVCTPVRSRRGVHRAHTVPALRAHRIRHRTYTTTLKKAQVCTSLYTPVLLDGYGSGGWIRTTDLRVMSPTSCHCSTPRRAAHGPTLPAGVPPVPSALPRFTTRFGMARGGSAALHARLWFRGADLHHLATLLRLPRLSRFPAGKPSSMRTPRLYPSRGLQLAPPARSSSGGLTGRMP